MNFASYRRVGLDAEHNRRQIEGSVKGRHYAPSQPSMGLLSVTSVEQGIRDRISVATIVLLLLQYHLAYDTVLSGFQSVFSEHLPNALRGFENKNGYMK
jgi:hypothetical protein